MSIKKELFELPFGAPPILPSFEEELKNLIECPEKLPIHQLDNVQCYWPRKYELQQLLNHDLAPIGTTIKFCRDPITGTIGDVHEINLPGVGKTSKNSMSMDRAPGPPCDGVRGNPSNFLFWPGGFDEPDKSDCDLQIDIDFDNNLKTCARGLKSGIKFQSDRKTPKSNQDEEEEKGSSSENVKESSINLMQVVDEESQNLNVSCDKLVKEPAAKIKNEVESSVPEVDEKLTELSVGHKIPVLKISENTTPKMRWAEQLNVLLPVTDFDKKVPDPALHFPYELDNFQKQAIIKLEENCNVFVAAHTSAGKTTVAEYAIALSQKHMTRAIYTSPIKALSNQKFREFKEKFESVGLITGDIQINVSASCLIMTTEILQSMLYGASEVIRDLEYVIFDEIHYINNEDRGHVWEEIVILLPPTVTIVMLSATVPNPIEFANWVGRIKQRKMFVISTVQRPVPLQHFLYCGYDMRRKDDVFLVVDKTFNPQGWKDACDAMAKMHDKDTGKKETDGKEKRQEKDKKSMKPKRENYRRDYKSDAQRWAPLVEHLIQKDKLPVVVFTFSRNRCNSTARSMKRSLITEEQKHEVLQFFKTSIKRLKDSDANLPQVNMIRNLLTHGIGIHHSGILPILKEIVEMLFQKGLVKMLFATETFAMGVNMPARTVIFDSISKFDGNSFRLLHPTEYIQMAGRAGRRGHDSIGTVMVLCIKEFTVCQNSLQKMMCGEPQSLQSRFKITYSMVLHLRRLSETISVKDMMRRSFGEAGTQHNQKQCMFELEQVEKELASMRTADDDYDKLGELYDLMVKYKGLADRLRSLLWLKKNAKLLKEDRVIVISHNQHINKLGVILSIENNFFKVLVLKEEFDIRDENVPDLWYNLIALKNDHIFIPHGMITYEIITISATSIINVTGQTIKCEIRQILSNWDNTKIYKSRNPVPNQACMKVIDQLTKLSMDSLINPQWLNSTPSNLDSPELLETYYLMLGLKAQIDQYPITSFDEFVQKFEPVFKYKQLLEKKEKLRQTLSGETMMHYAEYKSRVEILKMLGYIDQDERVTLKGRVALEMGTHELLLTELVLKNILTDLDPAEIAAVLSALVFQKRSKAFNDEEKPKEEPQTKLMKLQKIVEQEFEILDEKERFHQLPQLASINFELANVVYKWAKQESFASIMKHTDVQEGIIVRCIQQLNETLRDVRNAAIIIGNPILKTKMEQASTAIKRDIVFAASLYTQD